jgi:hypothetical protein
VMGLHTGMNIQDVPGGKVSILGDHRISHSEQKSVSVRVSYSEWFPKWSCFTVQFQIVHKKGILRTVVLFLIPVFIVQVTKLVQFTF